MILSSKYPIDFLGNRQHELCSFIRQVPRVNRNGRIVNHHEIMIYNCNYYERTRIGETFCALFDHRSVRTYNDGIHGRSNTRRGICGALTYLEIYATFVTGSHPFDR